MTKFGQVDLGQNVVELDRVNPGRIRPNWPRPKFSSNMT